MLNNESSDDSTYEEMQSEDESGTFSNTSDNHAVNDLQTLLSSANNHLQNIRPVTSDLILICSVCLDIQSEDNNEIIFCDQCGYAVHEACYGVDNNQRDPSTSRLQVNCSSSSDSDDPTELWFCEHCASESSVPISCELCPNVQNIGLFKSTDQQRWVHMICALYNKHAAFHDTDILWPVDLSDIPQNVYGEKICAYCDDPRMSRTGVCVSCEVGLCKISAHVSCAYRQGLIHYDIHSNNDDSVSFNCKQHCSEELISSRLARILAIQSFAHKICCRVLTADQLARKERILTMSRKLYAIRSAKFTNPNVQSIKSRPITSSPLAMKLFLQKQSINRDNELNYSDDTGGEENIHEPAFTSSFVNYFHAREIDIDNETTVLKTLKQEHAGLRTKEKEILHLLEEKSQLKMKYDALVTCANRILKAVKEIIGDSSDSSNTLGILSLPPPLHLHCNDNFTRCSTCNDRHEQDSLVQCDMCSLSFHIQCLDPPLDKIPKRHRAYRWHCEKCIHDQPDELDTDIHPNKRRKGKNRFSIE